MKKFIFDLQGVLGIKEKLEGQARVDFGMARARLTAEEEKKVTPYLSANSYIAIAWANVAPIGLSM